MTVDFATYCCSKDRYKLESVFNNHVASHGYDFNETFLLYQRCKPNIIVKDAKIVDINKNEYYNILKDNGINPDNSEADKYTHGWDAAHFWMHHCVNHLVALNESTADYIVLADADCHMITNTNWVEKGIQLLKDNRKYLVISPSDGTKVAHETNIMSQQLFLCERQRMLDIDFDLPFTGFWDGSPMQEYHFMLEGRIGRYMYKNNLYRYMLSSQFRYWHDQW